MNSNNDDDDDIGWRVRGRREGRGKGMPVDGREIKIKRTRYGDSLRVH